MEKKEKWGEKRKKQKPGFKLYKNMASPPVKQDLERTFLCSSDTFSGKSWTTCCFPNADDSRKQKVEPEVVSRQARTRPSHGPKMAPASMFWVGEGLSW